MNPDIFKAYDVRGLYPADVDEPAALAIGRATARFLRADGDAIAVGRDMRESGVPLARSLIEGIRAEGLDVFDIGRVATPMLYYATAHLGAAGGVMITASHNPGAYNGFKLCRHAAVPVGGETGLLDIRDGALELLGAPAPGPEPASSGSLAERRVQEPYYRMLLETFPARPALDVVIDAGNGIAGEAVEGLLAQLPLRVTRLYFEPDGSFPNHEANPLIAENLVDLQRAVRETGAALGIAFDGDGDRAVFVDERGDVVPADLLTALLARVAMEHSLIGAAPGASIVYDLRSSRVVPETLSQIGAKPLRSRVGHSFIKQTMRETGAVFGGELSGHYYFRFPEGYVADDGSAAALFVLQAMDVHRAPLSELWRPLCRYAQSGEVNRSVRRIPEALERVRNAFPDGEADELDGLTVQYPDWWLNLRPSNTEPLLRLNVEAPSEAEMRERRDQILALIEE